MRLSVIIPAHHAGHDLRACLESVSSSLVRPLECIVVDDGSAGDALATLAGDLVRVVRVPVRRGPANARNLGALAAQGEILLFLDSDVLLHADTIPAILTRFEESPWLGALFGSYDDSPACESLVSQYRNLLHCYVHRHGRRQASTFWAGCGAIRREVFLEHNGFDTSYDVPSIEDIEFGMRITRAGVSIALLPEIQVKHLKQWTLGKMLATDILSRGIPWTRLILASRSLPRDLNLSLRNRLSVALCCLAAGLLLFSALRVGGANGVWGAAVLLTVVGGLNSGFYRFLSGGRGAGFAIGGMLLHWLYFLCCGVAFAAGTGMHLWETWRADRLSPPASVGDEG